MDVNRSYAIFVPLWAVKGPGLAETPVFVQFLGRKGEQSPEMDWKPQRKGAKISLSGLRGQQSQDKVRMSGEWLTWPNKSVEVSKRAARRTRKG